ncbi:MAG: hypothetical protein WD049_07290, partial [Candidatus Paceibacterota bacterium]
AAWLRSLPTLMPVPEDQFQAEIQRRAAAVPDPEHRQAELEKSELAEMRLSRELCKQAGLEFQGFTGLLPNAQHNGRVGLGVSFMTDAGPHQCIGFDDRAILVNSETEEVVCEIETEE